MARTRLAILYGGRSAEHQISVVSARSVMEALDPDRFEVVPIAITRQGQWLLPERTPLELTARDGALPEVDATGTELAVRPQEGVRGVDVVFPILHGPFGEDGTVQGLFELADLPYVGSGVLASALAMDKAMAKVVLAQAGLPQAPYLVVAGRDWRADPERVAAEVAGRLAYPVFTKPARLGSSIGISKVKTPDGLAAGLADAFAHDTKAVVEQGIAARELECGVLASALAMDKAMAKVVLAQAGLPQAPYLVVAGRDWRADPDRVAAEVAERLAYPVFTKPARLGSSIGITKVKTPDGLAAGLADAFAHDTKAVVEQGIVARELECGVLGNDAPEASVVGEVIPGHEFYDFEAKYLDESLKLEIPAQVPEAVTAQVRELSRRAFLALGCEGFARVDFFYEEATGRVLVNEVNTIPGFTPKSMFPLLWAASGLAYPDLVARLVDLATERHAARGD